MSEQLIFETRLDQNICPTAENPTFELNLSDLLLAHEKISEPLATLKRLHVDITSNSDFTVWILTCNPQEAFIHFPPTSREHAITGCSVLDSLRATHRGSGFEVSTSAANSHFRLSKLPEHAGEADLWLLVVFPLPSQNSCARVVVTMGASNNWEVVQNGKQLTNGGGAALGRNLKFTGAGVHTAAHKKKPVARKPASKKSPAKKSSKPFISLSKKMKKPKKVSFKASKNSKKLSKKTNKKSKKIKKSKKSKKSKTLDSITSLLSAVSQPQATQSS